MSTSSKIITCQPRQVPADRLSAAHAAVKATPSAHPHVELSGLSPAQNRGYLSVLKSKRWKGAAGVRLTVSFLDNPPADLRTRIIAHMNAWNKTANVQFTATNGVGQVRISRDDDPVNGGYWSYLGTDILLFKPQEATMNLEGFTMNTEDSEFHRVVRHETGHTLGFPHEHLRKELVDLIDHDAAIRWYGAEQGWTPAEVEQQVLTPLSKSSILGTPRTDGDSIMCYQIPAMITTNNQAIPGGADIDDLDYEFAAAVYPKP